MSSISLAVVLVSFALAYYLVIVPLFISPLSKIPGPKLYALTKWRLALDEWNGERTRSIDKLHRRYGPVVRIGPSEVHFNSLTALRSIYGAGSSFDRTQFYQLFEAYGKENLFSFRSHKLHGARRKLLSRVYSKSSVMKAPFAPIVERKVKLFLDYIEAQPSKGTELFTSLHYFALDSVSQIVYGPEFGATNALAGGKAYQALLGDIFDPARRKFIWFAIHFNKFIEWIYTQTGIMEKVLGPLLPMQKPVTYTGVRDHSLKAWQDFSSATLDDKHSVAKDETIISILYKHHVSQEAGCLEGLEIASECSDHLLGGLDTTANNLMFLLWALSLPMNKKYQEKLIEEVRSLPEAMLREGCVPSAEAADKLVYLDAVIKESLRLYTPIQATLPRSSQFDTTIDGYLIPARTVVGMSPYSLHRNERVFDNALKFDPDRWLRQDAAGLAEMNKWYWPFSSGPSLCLGKNLVMAEMSMLVAAIYRRYTTSVAAGFENLTPVVTARFELFYDETMRHMPEHECWINFNKRTD